MKVTKINEKVELKNNAEVELQACYNDCVAYVNKTQGDYEFLKRSGCKVDGTATSSEIRDILAVFGCYCYKQLSPKTFIYW